MSNLSHPLQAKLLAPHAPRLPRVEEGTVRLLEQMLSSLKKLPAELGRSLTHAIAATGVGAKTFVESAAALLALVQQIRIE